MNLGQFIPAGLAIEDLIAISAAIAVAVSAVAVWQALLVRDELTPRLKALAERRAALKANMLASTPRTRRKASETLMHGVVAKLNLLRGREADKARIALAQAGIRSKDAVVTFLFFKTVMPFVLGVVAMTVLEWLQLIQLAEPYRMPAALAAVLIGFLAPGIVVKNKADKRRAAMQKGLPDALDLLVICAEAGLRLDSALTRVAREIGPSCPQLADELGLAAVELGFLPERRQALENLNQRTNMPSIRGVVNTLQQTEKYGTPLAQSPVS